MTSRAIPLLLTLLAPTVGLAQNAEVTGSLPRAKVLKVIAAKTPQILACHKDSSVRAYRGRLVIKWQINGSGEVTAAGLIAGGSSFDDAYLISCALHRLKSWRFPAPGEGKSAGVTHAFSFSGKQPPAKKDAEKREKSRRSASSAKSGGGGGKGVSGIASRGSRRASRPPRRMPKKRSYAPAPTVSSDSDLDSMYDYAPATEARRSPSPSPSPAIARPSTRPTRAVAAPAMKAGRHDDNNEYNRFLQFLAANRGLVVYPVDISERLVIRALDAEGRSLAGCPVVIQSTRGETLATATTYADGSTHFFPADDSPADATDYVAEVTCNGETRMGQLSRHGRRVTEIGFTGTRAVPDRVPVDIAIVIDTTGSMGSQINRLKQTLQAIHLQLTQLPTQPDIRFAMVAYRDRRDEYVTQVTPFTSDVRRFQQTVNRLRANGGGDTPEDLQSALEDALNSLSWRPDAIRLGFAIADARPHTDYRQSYTYQTAMRDSLARGIKWSMVGAGGLSRNGEVIFRQVAQFTMGEYVFVTQGGGGDSEGGAGEASHHVGSNYRTENLDQAIVRIVRRELSHLTDTPRDFDYTIVATGTETTPRDDILGPAVAEVMRQLTDYCAIRLEPKTPLAVVPVNAEAPAYRDVAEYLTEQLVLSATRTGSFTVVERDLEALAQEQKVQLTALFDIEEGVAIGEMIGAEVLVVSKLVVTGDGAQLYARLIRVDTGEILSAAKVELKGGVKLGV